MTVDIRPATPADLARLESIENAADVLLTDLLRPDEWFPASTGAARAAEPGFILVAIDSAVGLVGFVHVLEVDGAAHLEQLSVLPACGRRGIGRQLVHAAMDAARNRGSARMTLRTFAEVPWNAPFYASCGFDPSDPASDFERHLLDVEDELGLPRLGRRIQMTARL